MRSYMIPNHWTTKEVPNQVIFIIPLSLVCYLFFIFMIILEIRTYIVVVSADDPFTICKTLENI